MITLNVCSNRSCRVLVGHGGLQCPICGSRLSVQYCVEDD